MRYPPMLLAFAALAACASTEMRPFIGQPVEEVLLRYGAPEQVIEMPDGRRAYQFRWGGGSIATPTTAVSTGQTIGGVTTVTTTATPGAAYTSEGCLIAFIAADQGGGYVVEEIRPPREAVC